jgi:hypothetical protein
MEVWAKENLKSPDISSRFDANVSKDTFQIWRKIIRETLWGQELERFSLKSQPSKKINESH